MQRSNFSIEGLNVGGPDRNLVYYYGLSDFWTTIFEDSETINLLLEADSEKLSDVYAKFLQLVSTISINDIITTTGQQLKLILLSDTDLVQGKVNTYTLPQTILGTRIIANRPFLPTAYLEDEVNYHISDDGSQITFATPLSTIGFPSRLLSTGSKQYALWFVDALLDEQFVSSYFANLIGVSAEPSTDTFKNFIYGLYYLYTSGPNLALIRKGLNLTLGIPLARATEVILDIQKYLQTNQYLVITDLNSYLIPYGIAPSVAIGDTVVPTQELAQWIIVKDYVNDGAWWINLQIPPAVMPYVPAGQPDRYAKVGTYAEYLMANYLKTHTFLVNVQTIDFKNIQSFEQISSIIKTIKPTYTYPIYIWTIPTPAEVMLTDKDLLLRWDQFRCENLTAPIDKMKRLLAYFAEFKTDKHAEITIAQNQLTYTGAGTERAARANIGMAAGQDWFWEVTIPTLEALGANINITIGVGTIGTALTGSVGSTATSWGYGTTTFAGGGFKRTNGSTTAFGTAFQSGAVIGVYLQQSTGTLTFYYNGVSQGTAYTGLTGILYPMISIGNTSSIATVNFGHMNFAFTPPTTANPGVYRLGQQLTRGCPQFTRSDISNWSASEMAGSTQINGNPRNFAEGVITGYINVMSQFRPNTYYEKASVKSLFNRANESLRLPRSTIALNTRGMSFYDNSGTVQNGFAPDPGIATRMVFLYTTTQADLIAKYAVIGATPPSLSTWVFTLFKPSNSSGAINAEGINATIQHNYYQIISSQYNLFFKRGVGTNYLGAFMPVSGYRVYDPGLANVQTQDYLMFIRIYESTVAAFWVTSNQSLNATSYNIVNERDALSTQWTTSTMSHGAGYHSAVYFLRGAGGTFSPSTGVGIDAVGIDGKVDTVNSSNLSVTYTDMVNTSPVIIDRSGKVVKIRRDWQ